MANGCSRRVKPSAPAPTLYANPAYLYSPLFTAMVWPLSLLGLIPGTVAWVIIKVVVAAACVWDATRGWRPVRRVAAFVVVFSWLYLLADLYMGNTQILIAATINLVVNRPGKAAGVALGLALATLAKPSSAAIPGLEPDLSSPGDDHRSHLGSGLHRGRSAPGD